MGRKGLERKARAEPEREFGRVGRVRDDGQLGQSSVEYALVLVAFLAAVLALAAVWHAARDGSLQRLQEASASHVLGGANPTGGMRDIALF